MKKALLIGMILLGAQSFAHAENRFTLQQLCNHYAATCSTLPFCEIRVQAGKCVQRPGVPNDDGFDCGSMSYGDCDGSSAGLCQWTGGGRFCAAK